MTPTITCDEWLAEFERVMTAPASAEGHGSTVREIATETGRSIQWIQEHLRYMRHRLIVTRRREMTVDGRTCFIPCYRLKPED
jgi:predicted transcriptional regulator